MHLSNIKATLLILCIFLAQITYSQESLTMGNRIFGGGISLDFREQEYNHLYPFDQDYEHTTQVNSFSFSPYYGRLFKDHAMIGINGQFSAYSSKNRNKNGYSSYDQDQENVHVGFGTFLRYYFPVFGDLGAYVQPGAGFTRSVYATINDSFDSLRAEPYRHYRQDIKENSIQLNFKMGLYYFIFDQLTIETSLAGIEMSAGKGKQTNENLISGEIREGSTSHSNFNLQFINNISFDQVFTLNYYF